MIWGGGLGTKSPGRQRGIHRKEGRVDRREKMTLGDGEAEKNNEISVYGTNQEVVEKMKEEVKESKRGAAWPYCCCFPNDSIFIHGDPLTLSHLYTGGIKEPLPRRLCLSRRDRTTAT